MQVMICQVNPCCGDLRGNLRMMQMEITKAHQQKCDVVVFPELVTTGYPPRDLLYKQALWDSHERLVAKLEQFISNIGNQITVIFGGLHQVQLTHGRYARYNAAFIIDPEGTKVIHKRLLPCYDIFDETRYFQSGLGDPYVPVVIKITNRHNDGLVEIPCDILICEDIWNYKFKTHNSWLPASYDEDPVSNLVGIGPVFVLNGSPFWEGKIQTTQQMVEDICFDLHRPICWVNQVGAHDDIVTGGYSMVSIPLSHVKSVATRQGKLFAEDRMVVQLSDDVHYHFALYPGGSEQVIAEANQIKLYGNIVDKSDFDLWCDFAALKLHLIDYCRRTGFKEVLIGLSGGIDSALVAAIAADALGGLKVTGITMPSRFSSEGSWKDAEKLAKNLGMKEFLKYSIEDIYNAVRETVLSGGRQEFNTTLTDENIQPRARMMLLMTESNDNGQLVLTTGNKSELACGYMTIAGDTVGGLAVISDIPKTRVFAMCRFLNKYSDTEVIPQNTIDKPPSAELRPDQQDTDSLPPYNILDSILVDLIEKDMTLEEMLVKHKDNHNHVKDVIRLYSRSEYKRTQLPLGPKVTERSFGSGRRMPIACNLNLV